MAGRVKDSQYYTFKHFDYPKVSQVGGFFFISSYLFLQSKTVHFILNGVVPSRTKKKKQKREKEKMWRRRTENFEIILRYSK